MLVSLRRVGDDLVLTFYPEDAIAFRYPELNAFERYAPAFDGKSSATAPARMTKRSLSPEA
jgi:hypothetical protein